MKVIYKEVAEWIDLFLQLNYLRKKHGILLFDELLQVLQELKNNHPIRIDDKFEVFNLLAMYHISQVDLIEPFLLAIQSIYNLDRVIQKMQETQEKYGIHGVAIMLDNSKNSIEIPAFWFEGFFWQSYFPKGIIPFWKADLKRGVVSQSVTSYCEFIVDKRNAWERKRVFYTSDFRFGSKTFPSKEEMDKTDIFDEQYKWFDAIISSLEPIQSLQIVFENSLSKFLEQGIKIVQDESGVIQLLVYRDFFLAYLQYLEREKMFQRLKFLESLISSTLNGLTRSLEKNHREFDKNVIMY